MPSQPPSIVQVNAFTLKTRLDAGEPLALLDVREPFERDLAVIPVPGTAVEVAIPMGEIPGRVDELTRLGGLHSIIVYCHHGVRSMVVAQWLASRGVSGLANLDGGIDAWSIRADRSTPRY